jgi:arylsulfatase A-like enzyme
MKRNIVFLFADQMHGFAMGCMGNPDVDTPALDALADGGILFPTTYSNAPVCSPFRVNLLTGLYGSQTDSLRNRALLPPNVRTLPEALNDGGYRTSYVGKWHIGDSGNKPIPPELRGGFTEFCGYQCYNDFNEEVAFFDEEGNRRDFQCHRTEATTDVAVERLRGLADRTEPFALFVSYQNPHYPEQPRDDYYEAYRGRHVTRRPNMDGSTDPYIPTFSPFSPRPYEDDPVYTQYGGDLDEYLRHYYAMITQLDANVARMLKSLDDLGLSDDTLVVFTSDHGDLQCCHGLTGKATAHEESSRIPLIVRNPYGPSSVTVDGLVSCVDFYPSLLEWAGLPLQNNLEGCSFAPTLNGEEQELSEPVFAEMGTWCMVRKGKFKLVADRPGVVPTELYDLESDPYEMSNLVESPNHLSIRERLHQILLAWNRRVVR